MVLLIYQFRMNIWRLLLAAGLLPAARHILGEPATNPPAATLPLTNPPSPAPALLLSNAHGRYCGRQTETAEPELPGDFQR